MKGLRHLIARKCGKELGSDFGMEKCDFDGIGRIRLGVHTTARFDRIPRFARLRVRPHSSGIGMAFP